MREFFGGKRGRLLMAAAALLAGIMIFSARSGGLQTLPEKVLSALLYPFQLLTQEVTALPNLPVCFFMRKKIIRKILS